MTEQESNSYITESGIVMPCRRKGPARQRPEDSLGCTNTQCIFHPERGPGSAGTLGICGCPGQQITEAEQEFIRNALKSEK